MSGKPFQAQVGNKFGFYSFWISTYHNNKTLFLSLVNEDGVGVGVLTKELETTPPFHAYINQEQYDGINREKLIKKLKIGSPTGHVIEKGLAIYPLYKFDSDRLRSLCDPKDFEHAAARLIEAD